MVLTPKGLNLIKSFESLKLEAYRCPAGIWTIGYGSTRDVQPGQVITEQEAEALLKRDADVFQKGVASLVKVVLAPHRFDALVSLAFNIGLDAFGNSTLLKLLNAGDYDGAADQFLRWNKARGKVLPGLTRRRQAERRMFLGLDKE